MKPIFTDKISISERVANYIKGEIREGKFLEGEKILGEREMAKELNVSRNTVREAYKILEAYGYLKSIHGKGVFVAKENEQIKKMTEAFFTTNSQIKDLFAMRKVIEEKIVEWAVEYGTSSQIQEIENIVKKSQEIKAAEHLRDKLIAYDLDFHIKIADMAQNKVAGHVLHNLIDLLGKSRIQSFMIPDRPEKSVEEHVKILQAIKDRNVEEAKKAMSDHLDSVEKTLTDNLKEDF